MNITIETLQKFCAKSGAYPKIEKPFVQGNYIFATCARILIKVSKETFPDCTFDKCQFQEAGSINFDYSKITDWQAVEIPTYEPKLSNACDNCAGYGHFVKCDACEGTGKIECDKCGRFEKCLRCYGTGKKSSEQGEVCEDCNGIGKLETIQKITVRGVLLNHEFVHKIVTNLPNVEWGPSQGPRQPITFRFTGGEGLIMPMI